MTIPLGDLVRRPTDVASLAAECPAALAQLQPSAAGEALTEALPWMARLPAAQTGACSDELLADLRADHDRLADTGGAVQGGGDLLPSQELPVPRPQP